MLHCAMTNALTDITALAQSAGRIRLVWVWALQWSWKTAHLAFALTLYLAKRICSAQVVAVTPGSAGVFVVQWGIGLLADAFKAAGLSEEACFQAAMSVFMCCCAASYAYFRWVKADNSPQ